MNGLPGAAELLTSVADQAPALTILRCPAVEWSRHGTAPIVDELVGGARAALFVDSGLALLDLAGEIPDGEVLHPWLAPTVCRYSIQLGRIVLHGGVVATGERAVAVLGDREAGKSTLVAYAASHGDELSVLSDDLVVVEGHTVFAGPRCIDLRPSAAGLWRSFRSVPSRDGSRRRVFLPGCAESARLVGLVVLQWGQELALTRLTPSAGLAAVLPHLSAGQSRPAFERVLSLADLPVWRLQRPKDPALLDTQLSMLIQRLSLADPE